MMFNCLILTAIESIFQLNFYVKDYFIVSEYCFKCLPEICLIFFILYTLVTLFNDIKYSLFQYYKLLIILCIILFILI